MIDYHELQVRAALAEQIRSLPTVRGAELVYWAALLFRHSPAHELQFQPNEDPAWLDGLEREVGNAISHLRKLAYRYEREQARDWPCIELCPDETTRYLLWEASFRILELADAISIVLQQSGRRLGGDPDPAGRSEQRDHLTFAGRRATHNRALWFHFRGMTQAPFFQRSPWLKQLEKCEAEFVKRSATRPYNRLPAKAELHPPAELLTDFVFGKLAITSLLPLKLHLILCPLCDHAVEAYQELGEIDADVGDELMTQALAPGLPERIRNAIWGLVPGIDPAQLSFDAVALAPTLATASSKDDGPLQPPPYFDISSASQRIVHGGVAAAFALHRNQQFLFVEAADTHEHVRDVVCFVASAQDPDVPMRVLEPAEDTEFQWRFRVPNHTLPDILAGRSVMVASATPVLASGKTDRRTTLVFGLPELLEEE